MRRRDFLARFGHSAAALVLSSRVFRPTFAAAQVAAPPEGSRVHFALTTTEGAAVTEQSYRGKWLAVYFGYTFCPDVCPTTLMELGGAFKVLGPRADAAQVIFVTVDPQRDKPAVLAEYLKSFDPRFVGLTGSPAQIAAAARSFNVFYERNETDDGSYTYDHSSFIYLVDPGGKLAKGLTSDRSSKQIAADLLGLMNGAR